MLYSVRTFLGGGKKMLSKDLRGTFQSDKMVSIHEFRIAIVESLPKTEQLQKPEHFGTLVLTPLLARRLP